MTMTKRQYRRALEILEISQTQAASMLGIGSRSSRRYATDEGTIPPGVALALRYWLETGIPPNELPSVSQSLTQRQEAA